MPRYGKPQFLYWYALLPLDYSPDEFIFLGGLKDVQYMCIVFAEANQSHTLYSLIHFNVVKAQAQLESLIPRCVSVVPRGRKVFAENIICIRKNADDIFCEWGEHVKMGQRKDLHPVDAIKFSLDIVTGFFNRRESLRRIQDAVAVEGAQPEMVTVTEVPSEIPTEDAQPPIEKESPKTPEVIESDAIAVAVEGAQSDVVMEVEPVATGDLQSPVAEKEGSPTVLEVTEPEVVTVTEVSSEIATGVEPVATDDAQSSVEEKSPIAQEVIKAVVAEAPLQIVTEDLQPPVAAESKATTQSAPMVVSVTSAAVKPIIVSTFPTTRLRAARSIQNLSESTEIGIDDKKMTKASDEPLKTLQSRAKKSKIGVKTTNCEPLPSDNSPPQFPSSGSCTWSYDPISYVVLARLHSENGEIDNTDLECILAMMERPDITLVIEGLADGLDPKLWSMKGIERGICHTYHHKFAQFHRNIQSTDQINQKQKKRSLLATRDGSMDYFYIDIEKSDYVSMKLSDYFIYLSKREKTLSAIGSKRLEEMLDPLNPISKDDTFGRNPYYNRPSDIDTHVDTEENVESVLNEEKLHPVANKDKNGEDHYINVEGEWHEVTQSDLSTKKINVVDTCLYLTDYDLVENMPQHHQDLVSNFALPGVFPGASFCMMNAVSQSDSFIHDHQFCLSHCFTPNLISSHPQVALSWDQIFI